MQLRQSNLMKFAAHTSLYLIFFFTIIKCDSVFSQVSAAKPSRQSSMEAFSDGKYDKAYEEFSELLKVYPRDPLYNYYAGVCLVKLEKNPAEAVKLLRQAMDINSAARPLPEDALFYLARSQHLNGQFSTASDTYHSFADKVGKKAAKAMGVPELIDQCTQGKGAHIQEIEEPDTTHKVSENKPAPVPVTEPSPVVKTSTDTARPSVRPLDAEYSDLLDQALALQFLADSLSSLARNRRLLLETIPDDKKGAERTKISAIEKSAGDYQKEADKKYNEAHLAMNPDEKRQDDAVQITESKVVASDSSKTVTTQQETFVKEDTIKVFSYFKIEDKPVNDPQKKIEIDPVVPEGLVYRIQVAVFRNPVSPVFFKGITPVFGFKNEGSELKTYYAGMFRRLEDAQRALAEVKSKGFRDAFISSFTGRKQVSPDRAAVLEKEWGSRPFEKIVSQKKLIVPADTLLPTLIFRVEVMRVPKPPKPAVVESIKTLAGTRGLDIITLEDKKIAYLIGNFITFESAAEYADLIVRNGFRDAKVVAWLGNKEIPLDTAKQLFDNLR